MTKIRIVVAIITLLTLLICLALAVIAIFQGVWMVSVVSFVMAGLMSYFVYNDYLRFFKGKK